VLRRVAPAILSVSRARAKRAQGRYPPLRACTVVPSSRAARTRAHARARHDRTLIDCKIEKRVTLKTQRSRTCDGTSNMNIMRMRGVGMLDVSS